MPRVFLAARWPGQVAPPSQQYVVTTGQTFIKGAVVVNDGANQGQIIEASANPTSIIGVAEEGAFTRPGSAVSFDSTVVARTGPFNVVNVAQATRNIIFFGRAVSGGTDPVVPTLANIGISYGILRTAATEWVVNVADTTNTRVKVIDVDIPNNYFFFKFLESALANP